VAGEVFGVKGPVTARTPAYFIDLTFQQGTEYEHIIPKDWNCMIICHSGQVSIQENQMIDAGSAAVFKPGAEDETIKFNSIKNNTRVVMLAGQPLNEPIAQGGPFVLNEKEELYKAFEDF